MLTFATRPGHPRLTIFVLLGTSLPADLIKAERMTGIAWRGSGD